MTEEDQDFEEKRKERSSKNTLTRTDGHSLYSTCGVSRNPSVC